MIRTALTVQHDSVCIDIDRYDRTVSHEWLDQYIIESIEEVTDHAAQWLWANNIGRQLARREASGGKILILL